MHPTCQWLVDPGDRIDNPTVCGKPATNEVTVKTKITHAKVSLCAEHKRQHNVQFAQARTAKSTDHPISS